MHYQFNLVSPDLLAYRAHRHRIWPYRKPVSGRVRLDHLVRAGPAQFGPRSGDQRLQRVAGIG